MTTRDVGRPGGGPAGAAGDRLLLGALLLGALGVRLYALTGDMRFDPAIYAQYAWNLLHGTFSLRDDSWYAHRLVVFAPVAPGYALFGVGALASRLWPLALSLLQVGLVFELGRRLEGRAAAVLAGLFVALAPLDVVSGVTLQPDVVVAGFLCLAAFAWILAPERGRRGAALWPVVSGAAFALAVQARESAAPFALLYAGTLLWRRGRGRACLLALLGFALVLLPTLALYAAAVGDPLHRFRIVAATYADPAMREGLGLAFYPSLVRHLRHTETGAFAALFAVGLLASLARPRGARAWLLLWALPLLLYLQFGGMSLAEYVPVLKRERYLTCLTAPLALLAASTLPAGLGWLLARLAPRLAAARRAGWRNALLALLVAALAADSLLIVRDQRAAGERTARAFRVVADLVRREPRLPVLFDHWRTGHRVAYHLGFREGADLYHGADDRARMRRPAPPARPRLGYLAWYPDSARVPAALVVLDDDALARVREASPGVATYFRGEIPGYAYGPPRSWRLLAAAGTLRVYRTD